MMGLLSGGVLLCMAVLNGMKTIWGFQYFREKQESFWKVWNSRFFYIIAGISLLVYTGLFFAGGHRFYVLKYADLIYTYTLLAAVDIRTRKVPDRVLAAYLAGQFLMTGAEGAYQILTILFPGGLLFAGAVLLAALTSAGRLGMGDAKLLAVTALTAGWSYTLQILCAGMLISMLYGILMLIFRRLSSKSEIPFVPFLCIGVVIHFVWLL